MEKPEQVFKPIALQRKLTKDDCKHPINSGRDLQPLLAKEPGEIVYFCATDATNHFYKKETIVRVGIRLEADGKSPLYLIPKHALPVLE